MCSALLLCENSDTSFDRIGTCDKKWIEYNSRQRSAQCLDRDKSPKHFPKPKLHQRKTMVTVWYSSTGLIHFNFLNSGKTIAAEKYYQEIYEMNSKLQHMRSVLVNRKGPILLHNNVGHTSHK
ncbi:Histone-lysine N-methyltransferase SETMAR [Araneus ventricosus]|uniref:Histone-lysine N-methyltransferase SETMAR n=1 Tax=Araneus ventricosus TaxID=182803 RepID=A0A4Y2TSN8_ARAVE|nr:Histone-lysine N-methyltransferase SETMAR [Araneus ventricosus]